MAKRKQSISTLVTQPVDLTDKTALRTESPSTITSGSPVSSNMDFQALLDRPESKEMKGMIEM